MTTEYTLPPLPYAYDALDPVIDAKTMHLHHDLHHKAYVDGANEAQRALESARASGDFKQLDYWERKLAFHGSGHLLHSLLWENMAPPGQSGAPSAQFEGAVRESFGSVDKLRGQFLAAAKSVEGNGWAVLAYVVSDGSLAVLQVENHQKQTLWSGVPLLACDVWEHAYYLKYQNRRADFAQAFWGIINWNDVSARYAKASTLRGLK
jgi:Fe-Mn family superoxide dismutase